MFASMLCCGSTHDSVLFFVSSQTAAISAGRPAKVFLLAWDAAFVGSNSLLLPYTSSQLTKEDEGIWPDAFNFFQSSLRIHV